MGILRQNKMALLRSQEYHSFHIYKAHPLLTDKNGNIKVEKVLLQPTRKRSDQMDVYSSTYIWPV